MSVPQRQNLGRSSLLFLKTENFRVPSCGNGSDLRARARLRIENRPVKNQILGSQEIKSANSALHGVVASRSRSCAAARSLGSMGSISHEPGCAPGTKIAVETRW
jgi:hypothetical protein